MIPLFLTIAALLAVPSVSPAFAQAATATQAPVTPPAAPAAQAVPVRRQPPAGSGPVISQTELRFHPINESIIEPQTYL